jgi:hypothetical protein
VGVYKDFIDARTSNAPVDDPLSGQAMAGIHINF